jgi:hypothetical protein
MIAVQALKKRTEELGTQLDAVRAENAGLRAQALARTAAVTVSRSVPRLQGSRLEAGPSCAQEPF